METHRAQESAVFLGTFGHTIAPKKKRVCNCTRPKQFGTFPKRLIFPYQILSGYEEDVSSIRDGFSAWVKTDPEVTLRRHVVDAKRANQAFREAPVRKHSPFCQERRFNSDVPNRLIEQRRLSIYNWNQDFGVE